MPDFSGGTVVLDKSAPWFIVLTFQGNVRGSLVEGSQSQVLDWARKKYGSSVFLPETSVNMDPFSSAGLFGSNVSLVLGSWPTRQGAIKAAETGNYKTVAGTGQTITRLTGLDAIGAFFSDLTSANTWIRAAKVLIGGILVIVGVAKLIGMENGPVGRAVKVAPLL